MNPCGQRPFGAKTQAARLVFNLAPDDAGPGLFGQRSGNVELFAHQARGSRVRQEGQEYATGLVIAAGGVKADAVFCTGREYRMGQRDFAVVEHDHRDVLERNEGRLFLLDGEEKCSRRSLAGREIITLRQPTAFLWRGGVDVAEDVDVEFLKSQGSSYANTRNFAFVVCPPVPILIAVVYLKRDVRWIGWASVALEVTDD